MLSTTSRWWFCNTVVYRSLCYTLETCVMVCVSNIEREREKRKEKRRKEKQSKPFTLAAHSWCSPLSFQPLHFCHHPRPGPMLDQVVLEVQAFLCNFSRAVLNPEMPIPSCLSSWEHANPCLWCWAPTTILMETDHSVFCGSMACCWMGIHTTLVFFCFLFTHVSVYSNRKVPWGQEVFLIHLDI